MKPDRAERKPVINRHELYNALAGDLLPEALHVGKSDRLEAIGLALTDVMSKFSFSQRSGINRYAALRQLEAVYKKAAPPRGETPPKSLRDKAFADFIALEEGDNARTERRYSVPPPELRFRASFLAKVRGVISEVLTPLRWCEHEIWPLCDFGPGSTFDGRGPEGRHLLSKVGGDLTVTSDCLPLALDVIRDYFPSWKKHLCTSGSSVTRVKGDRLAAVNKTTDKARVIALQPSLNCFLQLGIGNWMVERLKHFGIDLHDQSKNRLAAQRASVSRRYATIDLSDASSRITRSVVKRLLPPDWYALLNTVRCKQYLAHGKWKSYNGFSAQGNGFTFPLETLIFWGIITALTGERPIVYGDDILVKSEYFHDVIDLFVEFGFKANKTKSFVDGPFRESCGGDYINGVMVRPVYYKEEAIDASDVCCLHNLLVERWGRYRIPRTVNYLLSCVTKQHRIFGPAGTTSDGDGTRKNSTEFTYRQWFWSDVLPGEPQYNADTQAFTVSLKRFHQGTCTLKTFVEEREPHWLPAILHAGDSSILKSSSILAPLRIKSKTLDVAAVLLV